MHRRSRGLAASESFETPLDPGLDGRERSCLTLYCLMSLDHIGILTHPRSTELGSDQGRNARTDSYYVVSRARSIPMPNI